MGASSNPGKLAKALRGLDREHGSAKVQAHLRHWLEQHASAEARFLDVHKFAETFGAWDPGRGPNPGRSGTNGLSAAEKTRAAVRRVAAELAAKRGASA